MVFVVNRDVFVLKFQTCFESNNTISKGQCLFRKLHSLTNLSLFPRYKRSHHSCQCGIAWWTDKLWWRNSLCWTRKPFLIGPSWAILRLVWFLKCLFNLRLVCPRWNLSIDWMGYFCLLPTGTLHYAQKDWTVLQS